MPIRLSRAGAAIPAVIAALLASSCGTPNDSPKSYFGKFKSSANVYVAPTPSAIHRVAVMPFRAPTELIGASVSDLFVTELLRTGRYQLVERSQLSSVLNETEVALSGISEARAIELGNMLGADGVVIGTVDEYATVARRGKNYPVVGLSIRLIDCASGQVMWSAGEAQAAPDAKMTLPQHARTVVHSTVAGLYQQWPAQKKIARPRATGDGNAAAAELAAPASAVRYEPQPPSPPSDCAVSDFGLREATLRWKIPSASSGLECRIERASQPQGPFATVATVPASRGTHTDKGTRNAPLADSTTYYYRIIAVDGNGRESAPGAMLETMTAPPPSAVQGLQAESGLVRCVALTWAAPPKDEAVERYRVYRSECAEGPFAQVAELRARDGERHVDGDREPGSLDDAATYFYRVRAINRVGAEGEESAVAQASTRPPPPPPSRPKATPLRPREVPIEWDISGDEKVVGYHIERMNPDSGVWERIAMLEGRETTRWTDRGGEKKPQNLGRLRDGEIYAYRIVAYNAAKAESPPSPEGEASTKPAPVAPAQPAAQSDEPLKITLRWKANPEPDIDCYTLEVREGDSTKFRELAKVKSNPYVHEGLPSGAAYHYRIRATCNDRLDSEWSEEAAATTKADPDAPGPLVAEWEDGQAILSWTAPPQEDIARYTIHLKKLLGRQQIGETELTRFPIPAETVGKRASFQVVAIDRDGLESPPSAPLEIRAPAPPPPPAAP